MLGGGKKFIRSDSKGNVNVIDHNNNHIMIDDDNNDHMITPNDNIFNNET